MKKMKRIAAILLAAALICCLSITAFAAGETYSITINQPNAGHTYEAYQIFRGDLAGAANPDAAEGTEAVLSNITWGADVTNGPAVEAHFSGRTAAEIAKALGNQEITLQDLIAQVTLAGTPTGTSVEGEGVYTISNLAPGYYLVKDKDESLNNTHDAYTEYIVEVVENSTVSPKSSVPTVVKKVIDHNDTTGNDTIWQDSADYDIGDHVPFQLKATLADNVTGYAGAYQIVFHDTLSAGLTYDEGSLKVYVGDGPTAVDASLYTVAHDAGTLTVTIPDVEAAGATDSSVIRVEYTATLNENALLGSAGNPNTVSLEFSNNPNSAQDTGETPEDKVVVFTYQLEASKVDESQEPLQGAGFTLFKKMANDKYVAVGEEVKGEAMTTFTWKGLDDGEYRLEETTTPAGYNTIAPIEFTITAEHEQESADPQLNSLTGGDVVTGNAGTGILETQVVNKAGSVLPETGGMGTTVLYVTGGMLVLLAVVFLVSRKLVRKQER